MGASRSRKVDVATSQQAESHIPVHPRYEKKTVTVLGKTMAYHDVTTTGAGNSIDTIVFVHGNPTCKYMWRNVMPHCEGLGRLVAVDLIGMGESDKLEKENETDADLERYSLKNQYRYFSAFLDAVGVRKNVTFVVHSWGGTLAAYWGSQNPHAVKGLVSLEVVYLPFESWERVPKKIRGGVKLMLRKPFCISCCPFDVGAYLILKKNLMVESMHERVNRGNFKDSGEIKYYRQPFPDPESRLPVLAFIRSIPVAGEPRDVADMMDAGRKWIENSTAGATQGDDLKILFLSAEPGTMTEDDRNCIRGWKNVTEVSVQGGHMVAEDNPDEIGKAIAEWFEKS